MLADDLFEMDRLDTQIIFLRKVPNLVNTIMAGNKDDLGARFTDLLSLDFSTLETIFFHLAAHGHGTAPTSAAIVVISLMFHGSEVFRKILRQAPIFFRQPTAPNYIAWILDGGGFL